MSPGFTAYGRGRGAPLGPGAAAVPPPARAAAAAVPPPPYVLVAVVPPQLASLINPQLLIFRSGQDIHAKILAFSQGRRENIVVMGCHGSLNRISIRKPASIADTVYEGLIRILLLQGGFLWDQNEGLSRRYGRFFIRIRIADEIIEGRVTGPMIASARAQVTLGTFDPPQTPHLVIFRTVQFRQPQTDT